MTGANDASSPMAAVEQICGSDTTNVVRGHREATISPKRSRIAPKSHIMRTKGPERHNRVKTLFENVPDIQPAIYPNSCDLGRESSSSARPSGCRTTRTSTWRSRGGCMIDAATSNSAEKSPRKSMTTCYTRAGNRPRVAAGVRASRRLRGAQGARCRAPSTCP